MKKNNFKSLMQAAVLICTPLAIASCDDVFGDVDNPIPSHLTVSQATVNLELHADRPDAATFIRKGIAATGAQLVYSSSDEKVATVDEAGKITGVGEGECKIIVKATGLDGNGNPTYQEAEDSFTVKVKDYRARIALKEGVTSQVFNSSLLPSAAISLFDVLDIWPKTGLKIQYGKMVGGTFTPLTASPTDDVIQSYNTTTGKITLKSTYSFSHTPSAEKHNFTTTIVAHIDGSALPDGFEATSFADKQTTAAFKIDVREGIAYITGYDANNKPIEGSMFYLDDDEEGTKPNYTILNTALVNGTDAYLKGGWYYLSGDKSFDSNIRVQGDVNFVFASGADLTLSGTGKSIMDATTNKSYKLNVLPAKGATYPGAGSDFLKVQDFSEVNLLVDNVNVSGDIAKVGTVNIAGGSFGNLTDIETLNFKSGSVSGKVDKVTTAKITDGTFGTLENIGTLDFKDGTVNGMYKIGTANITDGTFKKGNWGTGSAAVTAAFYDVTTLNIKEGDLSTANSNLVKIGTATISTSKTIAGDLNDITTLTLKGSVTGNMTKMGTATLSHGTFTGNFTGTTLNVKKGTTTAPTIVNSSSIKAALNIDGGSVTVGTTVSPIAGTAITGNITMNDGTLSVVTNDNGKHAIVGDVEVVKGTFTAQNANYVAVNGKLTGSFEESTNGTTWTKVTATTSAAPYVKNVVPTAAP